MRHRLVKKYLVEEVPKYSKVLQKINYHGKDIIITQLLDGMIYLCMLDEREVYYKCFELKTEQLINMIFPNGL